MDDYFEDYNAEEAAKTDDEYEFDAARFFDLTRPEFDHEIDEAERWFEVSGDYPPSPFIVKLNLEKLLSVEVVPNPSKAKYSNDKSIGYSSNADSRHGVSIEKKNAKGKSYLSPQDTTKVKTKSADKVVQPRSSTLMEPTASHLAKQKVNHKHSDHPCTRFQTASSKLGQKGLQSPIGSDNLATKRQKLDIGYLRKVAQLKHQFSLLHKSSKKVTIPKEPELETMLRAQRRRSKISSAASEAESQKQKFCNFKAHPLNKKILQTRLSPQPKKSPQQLTEFQVFHLKTTERANHHASAKVHPGATDADLIQYAKQKSKILKESRPSNGGALLESPPTEQFSKLSLGSSMKTSNASQLDRQNKRCHAKPKQCGGHMRFHEPKCWSDVSRSLDIR